jgi:hypothetical protein
MTLSTHTIELAPVYYGVLRTRPQHDFSANAHERNALYAALKAAQSSGQVRVHAFACTHCDLRMAFEVKRRPPEEFIVTMVSSCMHQVGARDPFTARLFEDSYRLASLDCEFALLELVCHIHLTPLLAGLTMDLAHYASSSYLGYGDPEDLRLMPWLTTHRVLMMLDRDPHQARTLLKQCVDAHVARIRTRGRVRDFQAGDAAFFSTLTRAPSGRSLLSPGALPRRGMAGGEQRAAVRGSGARDDMVARSKLH